MGFGTRRGTVVEHHRDVRPEDLLNVHGLLRPEKEAGAVEMTAKLDAVLGYPADLREAEDLEPPAVGEDREGPVHETVQTPGRRDDLEARAHEEMIGVRENDLSAGLDQFPWIQRLDRRLSAHGHEHRGLNDAM